MINQSQFINENLGQLNKCNQFKNEFEIKRECKHGDGCKSYIRCEQVQDENKTIRKYALH